jgi:hypothetical protein
MSNLSIKSIKLIINKDLTRIFCDVVKNTTKNKIWKREHHKVIVENFAFLLLLNKKNSEKLNFIIANFHALIEEVQYHYTNAYESKILHDKVWFIEKFNTVQKKFKRAQNDVKIHWLWKIHNHQKYRKACAVYIKNWIDWEYKIIQKALKISDLTWSITYDKKKVLRVAHSSKIIQSDDLRNAVKMNEFIWVFDYFVVSITARHSLFAFLIFLFLIINIRLAAGLGFEHVEQPDSIQS